MSRTSMALAALVLHLAVVRGVQAQDLHAGSLEYERLFSEDPANQPLPFPWLTLEAGLSMNALLDGEVRAGAQLEVRLAMAMSLGGRLSVTSSQARPVRGVLLLKLWVLEIDGWALYALMEGSGREETSVGGGGAVPIMRRAQLRFESSYDLVGGRVQIGVGLQYRFAG